MKARIPPKNRVAKVIMDVAVAEAIKQAEMQADDISARTLNEIWISMDQAGLSARTIRRVREIYYKAVLKKTSTYRDDHLGDAFCADYLTSRGLPCEETQRVL